MENCTLRDREGFGGGENAAMVRWALETSEEPGEMGGEDEERGDIIWT